MNENVGQGEGEECVKGVLPQLMADGGIKCDELSRIIMDLFIAAADTVSISTGRYYGPQLNQFIYYLLLFNS